MGRAPQKKRPPPLERFLKGLDDDDQASVGNLDEDKAAQIKEMIKRVESMKPTGRKTTPKEILKKRALKHGKDS